MSTARTTAVVTGAAASLALAYTVVRRWHKLPSRADVNFDDVRNYLLARAPERLRKYLIEADENNEENIPADTARGPCEVFATQGVVDNRATMRVYLACDQESATAAVAGNTFAGVWSGHRMSWVKPSAAWMAYRCGWTVHKDRKQSNVLALDVDKEKFEGLLMQAVVSHHSSPPQDYKSSPCVVQWDPERELDAKAMEKKDSPFLRKLPDVRSLQVGLRGTAWQSLFTDPSYVLKITDVTESFQAAHEALKAEDLDAAKAALWPEEAMLERRVGLSAELRQVIGIVSEFPAQVSVSSGGSEPTEEAHDANGEAEMDGVTG